MKLVIKHKNVSSFTAKLNKLFRETRYQYNYENNSDIDGIVFKELILKSRNIISDNYEIIELDDCITIEDVKKYLLGGTINIMIQLD